MHNIKKGVSSVMIFAILLSVLCTPVLANDTLTVKYWNADSSRIVLDLSHEVDADLLKAQVTLIKGETELSENDFTVVKKVKSTTDTLTDTSHITETKKPLTVDENYTYYIIPSDGISFDSVYSVVVSAGLTDTEGSAVLQEGFEKSFAVEKIWKEDFEGYSESNPNPWMMWRSGSTSATALTTTNSDTELTVTAAKDGVMPNPTLETGTFADTGKSVNAFFSDTEVQAKLKNYTLEAKVKVSASSACTEPTDGQGVGIGMFRYKNTSDIKNYYNKCGYAPFIAGGFWGYNSADNGMRVLVAANYDGSTMNTNGRLFTTQGLFVEAKGVAFTDTSEEVFARDGSEQSISISVLNENIKVAGGTNGFVSYDYDTTAVALSDYSFPVIFTKGCLSGHTMCYSIDDIIATKVSEVNFSTVEVTYFNADSSKIVVDMDKGIDTQALKEAITITKDGTEVEEFSVTKKQRSTEMAGSLTVDNSIIWKQRNSLKQ